MPRTYYQGPDAVIIGDAITWLVGEHPAPVKLTDVENIILTKPVSRRPRWVGTAAAIVVLTATAILASLLDDAVAWIPGGALAAVLLGYAWRPTRPRRWEMHATTRQGTQIVLYANQDKQVFDRVTRAVRRSIDGNTPPGAYRHLAS